MTFPSRRSDIVDEHGATWPDRKLRSSEVRRSVTVSERTEAGPELQQWVRHGSHRIPEGVEEARLDRYLAMRFPYRSRAQWARIIRDGRILVDGRGARPGQRLRAGNRIEYHPEPIPE